MFPSFMDWIPGPHHRIFKNFQELRLFIAEQIRWHRQSRRAGEPRDFIDRFLDEMDKVHVPAALTPPLPTEQQALVSLCPQEQQDLESHFQDETLVMTTHNLFFGGTETTSTTLRYGLLIMLKYPEVAGQGTGSSPEHE